MAQLSESERKEAQALAADALVSGESVSAESTTEADLGDAKDLFCRNWPMIKKVLQFIADKVGGVVAGFVRAVIVAGDFLHRRICSA